MIGLEELSNDPNHPNATAILIDGGNPVRPLRQPPSLMPFWKALASGDAVPLSDAERDRVNRLGIDLVDATMEVRERDARQAFASGVPLEIINAKPPTTPHYRPKRPVKITGSFVPVRKSY